MGLSTVWQYSETSSLLYEHSYVSNVRFKPKIYKLIHNVLYEHLSDMVAMVNKLIN